MVQLTNSFEGGTAGSNIRPGNSGGISGNAFDTYTVGGASATYSNARSMHGSQSGAFSTGSSSGYAWISWLSSLGSQSTLYGRAYINMSALPRTSDSLLTFGSSSVQGLGIQFNTNGTVSILDANYNAIHTMATVLATSAWYRFEWKATAGTSTGQVTLSIYAGDSATALETYTSGASCAFLSSFGQAAFGWTSSNPSQPTVYFDDVGVSTTGFLGPVTTGASQGDPAGAVDTLSVSIAVPSDQAGGVDAIAVVVTNPPTPIPEGELAGAAETLSYTVSVATTTRDIAGASDGISVVIGGAPAPTPSTTRLAPASPAFIRSAMPRMHIQNLLTGAWLHRDVQGITSPSITWALNTADAFTCSLSPPRPDLLDSSGNFLPTEWRDAIYLEESDEIKFGGILTQSTLAGPQAQLTAMGFLGYPNGMIYEGPNINATNIDALDAVRQLWNWLQSQPGGNLGLNLGTTKAGFALGAQTPPGASGFLTSFGPFRQGATVIWINDAASFSNGMNILINGDAYTIKTVEQTSANVASGRIDLTGPLRTTYYQGQPVIQLQAVVPWTLNWWDSTDVGQEIASIQAEAIFDFREQHVWGDPNRLTVRHNVVWGVPRLGGRLQNLRFAEGENIVSPATMSRDGTKFANNIVGLGAGSGDGVIRAQVANASTGRLRRTYVYTDQTVDTVARASAKATKVLTAMQNIDTVTSIVVKNHPNAPFGSFGPGDDIPVMIASGWRNTTIWSRITQMTQDPTTDLMTLTLARSDSFTYMAETGQAGTL